MEEVKKEEKPYFNFSWVIYIGVVIIGCILARVLIDQFSVSTTSIPFVYFNILMIIYGFVSCIIVYQLGKVIFSLIAGFKIVSINILLIGIRFSNGKAKLYFGGKDDYSVRVQIAPKRKSKFKFSFTWRNYFYLNRSWNYLWINFWAQCFIEHKIFLYC